MLLDGSTGADLGDACDELAVAIERVSDQSGVEQVRVDATGDGGGRGQFLTELLQLPGTVE